MTLEHLWAVATTVAGFILTGIIGWAARSAVGFRKEHEELLALREYKTAQDEINTKVLSTLEVLAESQRNQIKTALVEKFREVEIRGNISPMELDCFNRDADSYFDLHGNHYIHTLVARVNREIPIVGEPIPES